MLTRLADNGVKAYLFDENTFTIGPFFGNAIGFIKVVVAKQDAGLAFTLLDTFEKELAAEAICPKCGSSGFLPEIKNSGSNKLTAIFTWLFTNYAVAPDKVFRCRNCKYETPEPPAGEIENMPS